MTPMTEDHASVVMCVSAMLHTLHACHRSSLLHSYIASVVIPATSNNLGCLFPAETTSPQDGSNAELFPEVHDITPQQRVRPRHTKSVRFQAPLRRDVSAGRPLTRAFKDSLASPSSIPHALGRPPVASFETTVPTFAAAESAALFHGVVDPTVARLFTSASFDADMSRFIARSSIHRWADGTINIKAAAVEAFKAFLRAFGLLDTVLFVPPPSVDKSRSQLFREEDILAKWAVSRLMLGQSVTGTLQYVSHVRTWYHHWTRCDFGLRGSREYPSFTTTTIKSLSRHFPLASASPDDKREPITIEELRMLLQSALLASHYDMAAAMCVAWCSLCRFGEITNDGKRRFTPASHVTESSVHFYPSFREPTFAVLQLGPTKSDQRGIRDRSSPKILPVTDDFLSPGRWLKTLLLRRHNLQASDTWRPDPSKPLFLSRSGGQLKQDEVLRFVRNCLKIAGYSPALVRKYGTHSFRIGGFNRLFQLNVPIETIKHLGGWSSDAWKAYHRFTQSSGVRAVQDMIRE